MWLVTAQFFLDQISWPLSLSPSLRKKRKSHSFLGQGFKKPPSAIILVHLRFSARKGGLSLISPELEKQQDAWIWANPSSPMTLGNQDYWALHNMYRWKFDHIMTAHIFPPPVRNWELAEITNWLPKHKTSFKSHMLWALPCSHKSPSRRVCQLTPLRGEET